MSRRRRSPPRRAAPAATPAATAPTPPTAAPLVPLFEVQPAFEEEMGPRFEPAAVARAVLDERSGPGEQCRLLGARLRALGRDKRLRRIAVVGAGPGEGTTTVALGLARALSHDRRCRVLLLELDLRQPALDRALGLAPPAIGLLEYLEGKADVPVLRRSSAGFWVLSAGGGTGARRSLSSPRFAELLRAADRVFDYVVADCPPLLGSGDTSALQDHLDGFVYVVRSRHSERETIRRAATVLRPELIVGVVLNAQRDILPRRR